MFFYLLSIIMLSRLYPLYRDEPLTPIKLIILHLVQLLLLLFIEFSLNLLVLFALLIITGLIELFIEQKSSRLNFIRFIIFILLSLISLVFSLGAGLRFNSELILLFGDIFKNFNPSLNTLLPGLHYLIIITGLLFLLNESNFFIRLIFEITGKVPMRKETQEPDKSELNAGRVIGILERLIIFFFVIIGQFAAVGFVIAAKSIVRYRELEDRNFAEYVLIGTLLSSFLAILTGFAVSRFLA